MIKNSIRVNSEFSTATNLTTFQNLSHSPKPLPSPLKPTNNSQNPLLKPPRHPAMAPPSFMLLMFISFAFFVAAASQRLAETEVSALRVIAKKLEKTNWDFNVDPCSGKGNWTVPNLPKGFESAVICDCSYENGTECHITNLSVKGENVSGGLPGEFCELRYLQQLDLSRNVIKGTIPTCWSTLPLMGLSLMGNRLSGPFPKTLTNITRLRSLSIEANRFTGPIPDEIGNLVSLESLTLSANEFSGELPSALFKLTNLTDLRISSNNFTGKIPNLIKELTNLKKLHIQGCLMEGPIPSVISVLTNLTDLRITDLRGSGSKLPDLSGMRSLKTMMVRNCSIYGNIPSYIGNMKKLKYLDLSFNELIGEIPPTFSNLKKTDYIYLTSNILTGPVPKWVLTRNRNVDISYNNFTMDSSSPRQCLQGINMVESYSTAFDISTVPPCLKRNFPCSDDGQHRYSLHVNCGGKVRVVNGTTYEQDTEERGASNLFVGSGWAFSSTGNFMDDDSDADNYIAANTSILSMPSSELYTRARLSPIALTYYGLCMMNGNYTVKLHFAEIVFADGNTFMSLGKRLFHVYIQGKLVLEDFDIVDAAGGPGKPIIKTFTTSITNNTLKIQFYWAGKGTTGIPRRGTYGPLISAISVTPNFKPPQGTHHDSKMIREAIIILISALFLCIFFMTLGICWRKWLQGHSPVYRDLEGLDLQTGSFTLRQINAATSNFDAANKIGEGGFGSVYKGMLSDGTIIAVKQLSSRSKQGNREFVNEIGMISALQHPNLVKLYGCCTEGNQLLLVYEYMENNCLARALFGKNSQCRLKLDWPTRRKICIGIARGLAYLHEESRLKIVHRDIKASNILLDRDLNAKISDFGLAKLAEEDNSHISTRVAGTIGYMAPEYAMRGHLTSKADIYSFGVVALEIVSGKSNTNYRPKEEFVYLLDWAYVLREKGTLLELVDPELGSDYSEEEASTMLNVALLCTNASPTLRPSMSKVVSLLEGTTPIQPLLSYLSFKTNSSNGVRRNFWENPSETQTMSLDLSKIISLDLSKTDSSAYYTLVQENDARSLLSIASPDTISQVHC